MCCLHSLPSPSVPPFSMMDALWRDAVGISVVAFANNFAMAKLFARKQCYDIDSNTVTVLLFECTSKSLSVMTFVYMCS